MKQILKGIVVILVTLFLFSQTVRAEMPDLEGAELKEQGHCFYNGQLMECAVYEKVGVKYLLYAHGGRVVLIYRVKDGATMPYGPSDLTQVWPVKKRLEV